MLNVVALGWQELVGVEMYYYLGKEGAVCTLHPHSWV